MSRPRYVCRRLRRGGPVDLVEGCGRHRLRHRIDGLGEGVVVGTHLVGPDAGVWPWPSLAHHLVRDATVEERVGAAQLVGPERHRLGTRREALLVRAAAVEATLMA